MKKAINSGKGRKGGVGKGGSEKDPYLLSAATIKDKERQVEMDRAGKGNSIQRLRLSEYVSKKNPVARVKVRICPQRGGKWWREIGFHTNLPRPEGRGTTSMPCIRIFRGDNCPICELVNSVSKSSTKEASEMVSRYRSFVMNTCLCFLDGNPSEMRQLSWSNSAFYDILSMIKDPDHGDPAHPKTGYMLVANVKLTNRRYPDITWLPGRPFALKKSVLEAIPSIDDIVSTDVTYEDLEEYVPGDLMSLAADLGEDEGCGSEEEDWNGDDSDEDDIPF